MSQAEQAIFDFCRADPGHNRIQIEWDDERGKLLIRAATKKSASDKAQGYTATLDMPSRFEDLPVENILVAIALPALKMIQEGKA